jgi:cytochrome bd ubiquinol oxidase subunit II
MLGGAVFALYPNVLPAMNPAYSLTIENASAGNYGLMIGLIWWSIGITIALGYFYFVFKTFKGKVKLASH